MSATTRTKRRAEAVPAARDHEEANVFLARIGELQRAVLIEQTALAETIAKAKEAMGNAVAALNAEADRLTRGLQLWAEANRHALTDGGKRKSVSLAAGTISWRLAPPAVRVAQAVDVLQYLLERGMEEFLRRKVEIDKAAMLSMPERAAEIPGVTIASAGEEFVIEATGAREVAP
ncbi:host-nuclease inhibitor protein Gam [Roseomonas eburnea]|uniref:Host-nuclease inhibitor protein Gam n=1 Tax=Neoroseomonas eburnea TaxID=1346889 RepID=A0A9X9XE10_9PROT|nr:host-nuclease inhibitor Gam family protein [Neoroseomonas eburnea]MBR0681946.1 host-nuclease inhibitor protein Gam [Neoroseomonas eburnea]